MTFATLKIQVDTSAFDDDGMPSDKEQRLFVEHVAEELSEKNGVYSVRVEDAPDPKYQDGERDN